MTREEALTRLRLRSHQAFCEYVENGNQENEEAALDVLAYDMAITALREIDAMYATDNIGESMAKTLKQDCPYCSWIDPERLEDDPEDGPQNYCRVCGRYLRNPGEIGTKID